MDDCHGVGDYDEAVRFGQEALRIARTLGERAIEVVATTFLGLTHVDRGDFSDAATLLERNVVALKGDLRSERFGTPFIQSALPDAWLADVLSQLGRFDEAIAHAEAAVRTAETADHPLSLFPGVFYRPRPPASGGSPARDPGPRAMPRPLPHVAVRRKDTASCRDSRRRLRPRRPG